MQKPNTLLLIVAIVILVVFLPAGFLLNLAGLAWSIVKILLVVLAIVIIVAYFRKKKD